MWIKESAKKGKRVNNHYTSRGVDVFIKDPLPEQIDFEFVLNYIAARVPFHLVGGVEVIYVGDFREFQERDINAFFESGAIYVTNKQEEEMDLIEDIVHEIAHSIEKLHGETIFGDTNLEREFAGKRRKLENLLSKKWNVPANFSVELEYDKEIDDFLFREVGYDNLEVIISGLFPSSYSVTSINEYWAKGFEEMFIGDKNSLRDNCPILYNKLVNTSEEMK